MVLMASSICNFICHGSPAGTFWGLGTKPGVIGQMVSVRKTFKTKSFIYNPLIKEQGLRR